MCLIYMFNCADFVLDVYVWLEHYMCRFLLYIELVILAVDLVLLAVELSTFAVEFVGFTVEFITLVL